jgi:hypothetical protein
MRYSKIILCLWLSIASTSIYAEEHRQHGAHEHGSGQLNVAVEDQQLMVELSMPAMNVVGFEHAPDNASEQQQVEKAATLLKDGTLLFAPSPAGACKLVDVVVESALLQQGHEHKADNAGHEQEHQHEGGEHADFDVSYEFNCAHPEQLSELTLSLFRSFPATQHLRTQVISKARQSGGEVNAQNHVINLK